MTIKLFLYLFVFLFVSSVADIGWPQIIRERNFTETKSKGLLPKKVLEATGVKYYRNIASPGEAWNCCCTRREWLPDVRLNWAAFDSAGDWIVSYSTGGWATITTVKLIPGDSTTGIVSVKKMPADSSFAAFRESYLKDK